jgi:hypothetical protein
MLQYNNFNRLISIKNFIYFNKTNLMIINIYHLVFNKYQSFVFIPKIFFIFFIKQKLSYLNLFINNIYYKLNII